MIPLAFEAALLLALWLRWWAIPIVALGWVLIVVVAYPSDGFGGVALGAANAAVGTVIGVALLGVIERVRLRLG